MSKPQLKIFSGSSHPKLAYEIANHLKVELGLVSRDRFNDGEISIKYNENIRGADIFIIQSTNSPADNILELLIMIDAARRASAKRITAVMPYYGYARQDRKDQPRVPISAKLLANLFSEAGADRILTMDLHVSQIQGFFDIPLDHLYGSYVFSEYFHDKAIPDLVITAPDIGSVRMARAYSKRLKGDLAIVDKRRPATNEVEVLNIIGDVKDKNILFVDDIVDTASTLAEASVAVKEQGAKEIYVACSHALLSKDAVTKIMESPIKEFAVSDSLYIDKTKQIPKLKVLPVASLFSQAIERIHYEKSISILFDIEKL